MRPWNRASASLSLALALSASAAAQEWGTDFEKAKEEAKASGKDLLLDFTGTDW